MSKTMKWILGILIAVLVIGALGVAAFVVANRAYTSRAWMMGNLDRRSWDGGRITPRGEIPWGEMPRGEMPRGIMPMQPYNHMNTAPFYRFLPFGGLFFGLICLGGLALLIFGIVALVAGLTRSKKPAEPVSAVAAPAPVEAAPASAPDEEPAAPMEATPARTCPSCARPVNDDWSHCPYCGSPLTE